MTVTPPPDSVEVVMRYHEETKHHFFRYARALGYMDWANQPDPFRRFVGAPLIQLPLLPPQESPAYDDLYRPGAVASVPVGLHAISRFLEYSLAISAWKQTGGVRWALRTNPSSGNLHPTEGYLLIESVAGLAPFPALYHYAPKEHALELRAELAKNEFTALMREFPPSAFLFALTSVNWRETWKYGERAFRYCQHDTGHALGAARLAAAALGWRMLVLDGVSDDTIAALTGIARSEDFAGAEREHPDCVAVAWPWQARVSLPVSLPEPLTLTPRAWFGTANRLSRDDPVHWEWLDKVEVASWKATSERRTIDAQEIDHPAPAPRTGSAGQIIRQRRSALAFDGSTGISSSAFFTMLARAMPWDVLPWAPAIHLALFVHRVEGIGPGAYMLVRDPAKCDALKQATQPDFTWTRVPGCPEELPLFMLAEGDARGFAAQVSCHQAIAGDSAFSLGMIAEFEPRLRRHGAWFYRRLFWEAGVIGQVLYLEAEASGVRATGIGCYFDDPVHEALGFRDASFQSLYHFTTGGPVDDPRLTTLPPYGLDH